MSPKPRQRRYIADLHLGHEKVAGLRGHTSVAEHDDAIMQAWRRSVPDDDTPVFILGDNSSGGAAGEERALAILAALPGEKHLILGNHDRLHPLGKNARKHFAAYAEVFASVSIADQVNVAGRRVLLSHFPYEGDHDGVEARHEQWRLRDTGRWLLHGHVHEAWRVRHRQINVGFDWWTERFATDHDIADLITDGERAIAEAERYFHQEVADWGGGS